MIVFRVDGNGQIGLGHIMRCMSIADAFEEVGEECFFLLADAFADTIVRSRGFKTFVMNTRFDCMEMEFAEIKPIILYLRPRYIVVDSYFVTEKYFRFLGTLGRVAYLDDLAAFAYPVDVLINYNVYAADMGYTALYQRGGVGLPRCILGTGYIPLRKEFRDIPARVPKGDVQNVLVSTGGADTVHFALRLVRFLAGRPECAKGLKFHILLGAMNADRDEIMELVLGMDNIVVHLAVQDMKSLMLMCDLAVSAAGSTLYELCACGVPTITYVVADNQRSGAKAFERMGVMVSLGDIRGKADVEWDIIRTVLDMERDLNKRQYVSRIMQDMVDGYGAVRLVGSLEEKVAAQRV